MLTLSDKPSTSYTSHPRDPKTVLEYPKPPLSRLSDVIKRRAPPARRQPTDRQDATSPSARAVTGRDGGLLSGRGPITRLTSLVLT